jgi:hypothetical protein
MWSVFGLEVYDNGSLFPVWINLYVRKIKTDAKP